MKFFGVLVFALAMLVGMSQAATSPTTPTSTYTTPTSPSSPTTTTYTYTTTPTYSSPATTAKPIKQQFLSLLFNKKSG
ncbi:rho-related protein racD [Drosophila tropicalis]|uniref:rho-related protein racD n=1 Tax=Drosophila tropicalis TaxID=46794 RepID=UPI0035ABA1FB